MRTPHLAHHHLQFWCNDERIRICQENPGLDSNQVARILGTQWRLAPIEVKDRYHEKYQQYRQRFGLPRSVMSRRPQEKKRVVNTCHRMHRMNGDDKEADEDDELWAQEEELESPFMPMIHSLHQEWRAPLHFGDDQFLGLEDDDENGLEDGSHLDQIIHHWTESQAMQVGDLTALSTASSGSQGGLAAFPAASSTLFDPDSSLFPELLPGGLVEESDV
jgi:hypothetical protein